jgi:hypothetical protein
MGQPLPGLTYVAPLATGAVAGLAIGYLAATFAKVAQRKRMNVAYAGAGLGAAWGILGMVVLAGRTALQGAAPAA